VEPKSGDLDSAKMATDSAFLAGKISRWHYSTLHYKDIYWTNMSTSPDGSGDGVVSSCGCTRSQAPAPAGKRGERVPGFSDMRRLLFRSCCFLFPPFLGCLPLRLCSVAYFCQLVSEPVLLACLFSFDLGLNSEYYKTLQT
jgi:hypothetical protein